MTEQIAEALDLDAIQARADAATPGPWRWGGYIRGPIYLLSMARHLPIVMQFCRLGMHGAQPVFRKPNPNLGFSEWAKASDVAIREVPYRDDIVAMDNPDAEFIAHARADVPALVAELRAARECVPVLRELADKIVGHSMAPWPLDEIVHKQAWPALAAYDKATGRAT